MSEKFKIVKRKRTEVERNIEDLRKGFENETLIQESGSDFF